MRKLLLASCLVAITATVQAEDAAVPPASAADEPSDASADADNETLSEEGLGRDDLDYILNGRGGVYRDNNYLEYSGRGGVSRLVSGAAESGTGSGAVIGVTEGGKGLVTVGGTGGNVVSSPRARLFEGGRRSEAWEGATPSRVSLITGVARGGPEKNFPETVPPVAVCPDAYERQGRACVRISEVKVTPVCAEGYALDLKTHQCTSRRRKPASMACPEGSVMRAGK